MKSLAQKCGKSAAQMRYITKNVARITKKKLLKELLVKKSTKVKSARKMHAEVAKKVSYRTCRRIRQPHRIKLREEDRKARVANYVSPSEYDSIIKEYDFNRYYASQKHW